MGIAIWKWLEMVIAVQKWLLLCRNERCYMEMVTAILCRNGHLWYRNGYCYMKMVKSGYCYIEMEWALIHWKPLLYVLNDFFMQWGFRNQRLYKLRRKSSFQLLPLNSKLHRNCDFLSCHQVAPPSRGSIATHCVAANTAARIRRESPACVVVGMETPLPGSRCAACLSAERDVEGEILDEL